MSRKSCVIIFTITCFLLSGCPAGNNSPLDENASYSGSDTFLQKVLIEEVTGTWCGYCPDGIYRVKTIMEENPDRAMGVALHYGDDLAVDQLSILTEILGGFSGVPCGAVNRNVGYDDLILTNRGYWQSLARSELLNTSKCGIKIESVLDGAELSVMISFVVTSSPTDNLGLTVYITEDEITGYPQSNFENDDADSPYYQMGQPIVDFTHNHVLRKILSDARGDEIPGMSIGVIQSDEYNYTIPAGLDSSNMKIIAFVHKKGTVLSDKSVLNVQWCSAGGSADFSEL